MKKKYLLVLLGLSLVSCSKALNKNLLSNNQESIINNESNSNSEAKEVLVSGKLNLVNKPVNKSATLSDTKYIDALTKFTSDFSNKIIKDENFVFSPVSIYNCYGMLFEGTSDSLKEEVEDLFYYSEIDSLKESVREVMEIMSIDSEKTKLDTSNSIWINHLYANSIKDEYLEALQNYYYSEAYSSDFLSDETKTAIAEWVNSKTNNMFKVDKNSFNFSEETVFALFNSVYLKSQWVEEFNEYLNEEGEFNSIDNEKVSKTFMRNMKSGHVYHGSSYDISKLYLKGNISFNMLLPNEGEDYLSVFKNNINQVINPSNLDKKLYLVNYKVPQFKTLSSYNLVDELKKMGVNKLFNPSADYDNLMKNEDYELFVSSSIHEAGIEVANYGIEAAAYTMIGVDATSAPGGDLEYFEFTLDRPFLYSITYKDLPLFVGAYVR